MSYYVAGHRSGAQERLAQEKQVRGTEDSSKKGPLVRTGWGKGQNSTEKPYLGGRKEEQAKETEMSKRQEKNEAKRSYS